MIASFLQVVGKAKAMSRPESAFGRRCGAKTGVDDLARCEATFIAAGDRELGGS